MDQEEGGWERGEGQSEVLLLFFELYCLSADGKHGSKLLANMPYPHERKNETEWCNFTIEMVFEVVATYFSHLKSSGFGKPWILLASIFLHSAHRHRRLMK